MEENAEVMVSVLRLVVPTNDSSIESTLDRVGATRVRVELPYSRAVWSNSEDEAVAHARCVSLLSYCPVSRRAQSPVDLPGVDGPQALPSVTLKDCHFDDINEDDAATEAGRLARQRRVGKALAIRTASGRVLFVAIESLCIGPPPAAEDDPIEQASLLVAWARDVLGLLVRVLGDGDRAEADRALVAFDDALVGAMSAVRMLPVARDLAGLRSEVVGWRMQILQDQLAVAIRVRREQLRWTEA